MTFMFTSVIVLSWPEVLFSNIGILVNDEMANFVKHHLWMKIILDPLSINSTNKFLLSVCLIVWIDNKILVERSLVDISFCPDIDCVVTKK